MSVDWRSVEWVRITRAYGASGKRRPFAHLVEGQVYHVEDYERHTDKLILRTEGRNCWVGVEYCEPAEEPK